jgi:hypothetical protein
MRNGLDITALYQFLYFIATVSILAIGGHEQGGPSQPAEKHDEDRMAIKRA